MTKTKQYHFSLKGEVYEVDIPEIVIQKIQDLENRVKTVCRSHFEMCGKELDGLEVVK